jgi:hypothetical protein
MVIFFPRFAADPSNPLYFLIPGSGEWCVWYMANSVLIDEHMWMPSKVRWLCIGPCCSSLDTETYKGPGFLDSNALVPGLITINRFTFPAPMLMPENKQVLFT